MGEDVKYALVTDENKNLFMNDQAYYYYDAGKGVAGYRKIMEPGLFQGTYFICLYNDNVMQGIDVNVKVITIIETTRYKDEPYEVPIVKPIRETKIFSEPEISRTNVPVIIK
jgi:hypothetical protein